MSDLIGGGITPITYNPTTISTWVAVNEKTYAKDILEKIKEEINDLDLGFADEEYRTGVAYGIMKITDIINKHLQEVDDKNNIINKEKASTAYWVKKKGGGENYYYYSCSKCACIAPNTEMADEIVWKLSNYCPDCGRKMEVEK